MVGFILVFGLVAAVCMMRDQHKRRQIDRARRDLFAKPMIERGTLYREGRDK